MRLLSRPYAQLSKCLLNGPIINSKWDINLRIDKVICTGTYILIDKPIDSCIFYENIKVLYVQNQ